MITINGYLTEAKLESILKQIYQNVIHSFKIPETRYRCDYLIDNKIVIEFDGDQHYRDVEVIYRDQIKDNLIKQEQIIKEYMIKNGIKVDKIYKEIASGMNENRKEFNNLISDVQDNKIDKIFISYKDRLSRFGFSYFENFFKKYNTEIIVLNATDETNFEQELTEDLISIIHHFSMKMYSNRRKKLKEIEEQLKNENNKDSN